MSRKPRFKVQRKNSLCAFDRKRHGRKQWVNVYSNDQKLGYTLTFDEATALYWQMTDRCVDHQYRIVEKR
jgi:hypothetical protein